MKRRNGKDQAGFSLLEVLIAVLVLSIGLLGMAGLQLNSLKFNQTATTRSQATVLAYDIADRMRANRAVAKSGGYVIGATDEPTGTTVAATDLTQWKAALNRYLPSGNGSIAVNSDIVTITVVWDESRVDSQSNSQQFVFETRL